MTTSTIGRHLRPGRWLRGGLRGTLVAAAAASAVLAFAGAASAHVEVSGVDATRGGYGVLTFRVPTESATASTTRLRISFPSDHPISSVATQPVPGWTASLVTRKLQTPVQTDDGPVTTYVAEVDWRADGARDAIHPGEFQMFSVSAGPLPDAASVAFPTVQYYSDGTKVAWNESSSAGAEPEHPAPVLDLAPAADEGCRVDPVGRLGVVDAGHGHVRLACLVG